MSEGLEPFGTRLVRELVEEKAIEGEYRPGPYYLPITGGFLSAEAGQYWNWWQLGYNVEGTQSRSAMVEACISAYSQTVAMCPGDHWRATYKGSKPDGGRERVETSALSRILRYPNAYETISDFLLNATRSLYSDGNAYALALRNSRFEIEELHLMSPRQCQAYVAETGDVFYSLGGNAIIEKMFDGQPLWPVPARDVLHIKLHTKPGEVLKGYSPLCAAALDIAANDALLKQQLNFFLNQGRPSTVLTTDQLLPKEAVEGMRQQWDEKSRGLNTGGTVILNGGLKPIPLTMTSQDAQVAEIQKLTEQHIALAFRVPLQILGLGNSAGYGSTEALMQHWIANGFGFCLNHIEEAFGRLFQLDGQPWEYVEFDTKVLLRSAMKDRMESLSKGVLGGILSPNEARADMELSEVKFGDEPRVQQQVVPLSAAAAIPASPSAPPAPAQPIKDTAAADRSRKDAIREIINGPNLLAASRKIERQRQASH